MASSTPEFTTPPPSVPNVLITFPEPHILLATLNRPDALNCIPRPQHFAMGALFDWYDEEPSLRCAIITGTGRAFCAGADLKEWNEKNQGGSKSSSSNSSSSSSPRDKPSNRFPPSGFGGMSNRGGTKPIIGAVNGICFGGGMEMAINCDMLVASEAATFALPEVTIGVIALAGALPRLIRTVGKQRATEMALTGKRYGAAEMLRWGLLNEVVPAKKAGAKEGGPEVLEAAMKWARMIAGNSPDAVIVSREGLKMGWEGCSAETGVDVIIKGWYERIEKGENMIEGVASFVEKRKPVWKNSKL
ncbi:mevalonyl-CoA hydratase [Microdochium nivale]|nr:mevalonyl-CoA hydratase [Microdochium nivale]